MRLEGIPRVTQNCLRTPLQKKKRSHKRENVFRYQSNHWYQPHTGWGLNVYFRKRRAGNNLRLGNMTQKKSQGVASWRWNCSFGSSSCSNHPRCFVHRKWNLWRFTIEVKYNHVYFCIEIMPQYLLRACLVKGTFLSESSGVRSPYITVSDRISWGDIAHVDISWEVVFASMLVWNKNLAYARLV